MSFQDPLILILSYPESKSPLFVIHSGLFFYYKNAETLLMKG